MRFAGSHLLCCTGPSNWALFAIEKGIPGPKGQELQHKRRVGAAASVATRKSDYLSTSSKSSSIERQDRSSAPWSYPM